MGIRGKWRQRNAEQRGVDPTSENIDLIGGDDNVFAESVDEGHRIDPRAQKIFVLVVVLVVVYVFGCIFPKDLFNWERIASQSISVEGGYTFSWFVSDLQANVSAIIGVLGGNEAAAGNYLSTMLRYVVVAVAGAGLALSGAVYQGAFRNALVSPSTLGVMTGGSLGMTLWVVVAAAVGGGTVSLGIASSGDGSSGDVSPLAYLNSSYGLALVSFLGCFLVVGLVLLTVKAAGARKMSGIFLIITGQVVSGALGVIGTTIRYYYTTTDPFGDVAQLLQNLQVASFYREFGVIDIFAIGIPLAITFLVVMALRQKMMLLAFDATEQRTLGIDTRRMQIVVVGLTTLLTAIIISFCGTVGFVGFLVPHLARRLVGPNFKYLLPASTVIGAIFVLGAYLLVEMTLGPSYTTMVGMYISIFGAVIFLATALRGGTYAYGTFK